MADIPQQGNWLEAQVAQECLNHEDWGYFRTIKYWLIHDLNRSVESVTQLVIPSEILQVPPEEASQQTWKEFKPGNHHTYTLTFADGFHASITFEPANKQKEGQDG